MTPVLQTSAVLPKSDVEEYIRLHAQAATIEKRMGELKKPLLEALVNGAVSPIELPFVLVNRPQNRKESDWPGFIVKLLRPIFGSTAKAKAEFARIDARWPKKEIPALHVEKNPAYAAELGATA